MNYSKRRTIISAAFLLTLLLNKGASIIYHNVLHLQDESFLFLYLLLFASLVAVFTYKTFLEKKENTKTIHRKS